MTEESPQKDSSQKSSDSSEDQQSVAEKKQGSLLNKLIFVICCSIVAFVGLSFIDCAFFEPSIESRAKVLGTENVSSEECKESESTGYETLLSVLTTIIALRTKLED